MYVTRIDVMASLARIADYEAWTKKYGDFLKTQKGFQRRVVANSYGYPTKYTALTRWESREAGRAWIKSPNLQTFLKANPIDGLFTATRPIEDYEVVISVGDPAPAGSLRLVEWNLDNRPGNAEAFESARKELFELARKQAKGFVLGRLLKFMGGGVKYLVFLLYKDRDSDLAFVNSPEFRQFFLVHRGSDYSSTPAVVETFEVVHQIL